MFSPDTDVFTFKLTPIDKNKIVEKSKPDNQKIIVGGSYNELDKKEMNESKKINKSGDNLKKFIEINL